MNCHSFINVLDLYREGRLTARRARAAESHLAGCAACRASAAPAAAAAPSAPAPRDLKARLLSAARSGPAEAAPAAAPGFGLPLWPRDAGGLALAAAVLIIVGLLISATGAPSQSPSGAVAAMEEP